MKNVMFDLETFGTTPGSALRSIGAAFFDPETGAVGKTFYANIDRASCVAVGLLIDPGTEAWWAKQSKEAQAALLDDPQPLPKVASAFHAFFKENGGEKIWCQGANFDSVLWEAAVAKCWPSKNFIPWRFWNVRDTRTVYDIAGFNEKAMPREGTYHDALADCLHQIRCVHAAVSSIRADMYA